MTIIELPMGRIPRSAARGAIRHGVATSSRFGAALQLVQRLTPAAAYCAACAAPIDFGAVWRGQEAFCSVECSLGGTLPA
jgi:hypothetical protein